MDHFHRRIFISSISATAGAMRQPMQNSMNSITSMRRLPDSLLPTHHWFWLIQSEKTGASRFGLLIFSDVTIFWNQMRD
jgi:hypothetical protein